MPRDSALLRELHGDAVEWGLGDMLQARTLDAIAAGNWQRGGGKGPRPTPIPIPGVKDTRKIETRIGGNVVRTPAQIDELLARWQTPEVTEPEAGVVDEQET